MQYFPHENSSIIVTTAARLHMGFFDLHGGLGRKFGSIGLSLSAPSQVIGAMPSKVVEVDGLSTVHAKAHLIAQQMMTKLSFKGGVRLTIHQHIPEHIGLGSGTQLALAIGSAISQLYGLNLSTVDIAQLTGRGIRSGIGIAAFEYGGILIDGGRVAGTVRNNLNQIMPRNNDLKIPPLLARYDFPAAWRILLILDSTQPGIHGAEERAAFNQLPVFSENTAAHLCRHVLMEAMPALIEQDLSAFGRSIQVLQAHVGDYFSPAQGGRYASKRVRSILEYLESVGVACFGQSSWGPTGFAVFESADIAEQHLQKVKATFTDSALSFMICNANNQGATVSHHHHESSMY